MKDRPGIRIRNDIRPGDIGALIRLHGTLYNEEFGYDTEFEAYVAKSFFDFISAGMEKQRLWIVEQEFEVLGCIGIARKGDDTAQLRWLLLHPGIRGRGLAGRLVQEALDFAAEEGYRKIFLLTEDILTDAAKLYVKFGFEVREQSEEKVKWGARMRYQRYERDL
jgi:N-acetylglutamate synthase-like GNAT family acetyltransferase